MNDIVERSRAVAVVRKERIHFAENLRVGTRNIQERLPLILGQIHRTQENLVDQPSTLPSHDTVFPLSLYGAKLRSFLLFFFV